MKERRAISALKTLIKRVPASQTLVCDAAAIARIRLIGAVVERPIPGA
jgi:hypothetical protein